MQQKLNLEGIINTLILQNKKSKINKNFRFKELEKEEQIKNLEKEEQTKPKVCKRNEILKIRAEINEIKNLKNKQIQKLFFAITEKTDKPLARLIKREETKLLNSGMNKEYYYQTFRNKKGYTRTL